MERTIAGHEISPLSVFYDRAAAAIVHFPSPSYHPSDSSTSVISPLFSWPTTGRRKWNFLCDIAQKLIRLTCSLCPSNSRRERRLARAETQLLASSYAVENRCPLDTPSVSRAWRRHRARLNGATQGQEGLFQGLEITSHCSRATLCLKSTLPPPTFPPPFSTPLVLLCIFNSQLCNRPRLSPARPNLGYRLPPSPIGFFPDPNVPFSLRPTPPSNPRTRPPPRRRRRRRPPPRRSRRPSSTIISPGENLTLPFEGGREIVLHLFARRNNVDPGVYIGTPVYRCCFKAIVLDRREREKETEGILNITNNWTDCFYFTDEFNYFLAGWAQLSPCIII